MSQRSYEAVKGTQVCSTESVNIDSSSQMRKPRWPPGAVPSPELIKQARTLGRPSIWFPVVRGTLVHVATVAAILLVAIVPSLVISSMIAVSSALLIAIGYRGLENLVHSAAHYNLSQDRKVNDAIADVLFGAAVAQDISSYRYRHRQLHHARFNTLVDPCRKRMIGHPEVKKGLLPSLMRTLAEVPRETVAYYRTVGANSKTLLRAIIWQFFMVYCPVALIVGITAAAKSYFTVIAFALLFLPLIRTLAEAGEHDYADESSGSVLECTFDNRGFLNAIIHPFGDAYHLGHHLFDHVPQWRLKDLHMLAMRLDESYSSRARYRSGILTKPRYYRDRG